MFRHGDRSAIGMIPNDIYNVSSWPMGPGELTTVLNKLYYCFSKYFRHVDSFSSSVENFSLIRNVFFFDIKRCVEEM